MRYISVFSGIEAATVAWEPLGWTPICFAEMAKFPSRVLSHHYPGVPNVGDVTAHDWSQYHGKCDLVVGGPPCQAFSIAGLRRSLQDDRGNLSLQFVRIVDAVDPWWCVAENVPGWLNTEDNAFGCFLAGMVGEEQPLVSGTKTGKWPDAGVVVGPRRALAWRVLDAQYRGLAQRRRRVFVVIERAGNGDGPAAILFEPESLPRHSPPSREAGSNITGCITARLGTGGPDDNTAQVGNLVAVSTGDISHCPNAGGMGRIDYETETMVVHSLRGEGFDASEDGTGRGTPIMPVAFDWYASRSQSMPVDAICPPLKTTMQPAIANGFGVRRLMPIECERLQGFSDGYTDIPGAADGPRYKAIGNSMAVPVMQWIGERIKRYTTAANAAGARDE